MTTDDRNLYERIQAVSIDIMNLEKDKKVGEGKSAYKAVSDQQVVLAVKQSEQKNGIISIPLRQELLKSEVVRKVKDGYETISYVDIVKMTVKIFLLSDPTQFVEIDSLGRGLDSGDKGLGKASTYARKYALLNAYKIATGEDPDLEKSKDEKSDTVDEKKQAVTDYALKNMEWTSSVCTFFNISTYEDMTQKMIEQCYSDLKKKGKI
jgi:hypothetical protein